MFAQSPELKSILERLDRLELDNRALREELRELRKQAQPQVQERLDIQESRIEEQAQAKVEASQRFPIHITGMALFNLFHNGGHSGGLDTPLTASTMAGPRVMGATFRQSVLGLEYYGPATVFGGKVRGSFMMDFFSESPDASYSPARIRTASIEVNWKTRSVLAGIEKPLFAPREPNSLLQVGVSPLTGAGNLWRWQPQVRLEQRVRLSQATALRAQIGVLETSEDYGVTYPVEYLERRRPGLEGRFEISRKLDDQRRIEIAPGFHTSATHAASQSAPSNLFSLDWFANPWRKLEFTGAFFSGQNVAHLGGLRQGYRVPRNGLLTPVHSQGGWAQFTFLATGRLSFNVFGGEEDPNNADLRGIGIARNRSGAVNVMYRLAPNVVLSLETLQTRTNYLGSGARLNNRYDLAVAYLF